jgi:hypothetical protein
MPEKNASKAARPPAEAPMPTTGNGREDERTGEGSFGGSAALGESSALLAGLSGEVGRVFVSVGLRGRFIRSLLAFVRIILRET